MTKTNPDIEKSYKLLEVRHGASLEEVKQAFRDLVHVWHPDRFPNNPRLKEKAERKMKEIVSAYEVLKSEMISGETTQKKQEPVSHTETVRARDQDQGRKEASSEDRPEINGRGKTEAVVEAGTRLVLSGCAYIFGAVRILAKNLTSDRSEKSKRKSGIE